MIKDGVNLPVDGLNKFCSKLINGSRDIAIIHGALDFNKAGISIDNRSMQDMLKNYS